MPHLCVTPVAPQAQSLIIPLVARGRHQIACNEGLQPMSTPQTDAPETVYVDTETVRCDGGELGHPMVYLNLTKDGWIDCPYCDKRFVKGPPPASAA
jgi:uncharacterized Zn-finger protein